MNTRIGIKRVRVFAALGFMLLLSLSLPTVASAASATVRPMHERVGHITEYHLPKGFDNPGSIATGPDGALWFSNQSGQSGYLGRITPQGQFSETPEPGNQCGYGSFVLAPDGNMWAMGCFTLALLRINPHTLHMTLFTFGSFYYSGAALTVGSDGNLWLLEDPANNTIDRFSLRDHSLTTYAIPTPNAQAYGLTSGADGNLWFTEDATGKIGRLNPKTGQITEYTLPYGRNANPRVITPGPKGDTRLWFVLDQGIIGWINPFTGQIAQFTTPDGYAGPGISAGPDGNLWFTDGYAVCRATTSANLLFAYFLLSNKNNRLVSITAGPDGNMWFTENYGNKIGKITTR